VIKKNYFESVAATLAVAVSSMATARVATTLFEELLNFK